MFEPLIIGNSRIAAILDPTRVCIRSLGHSLFEPGCLLRFGGPDPWADEQKWINLDVL